MTVSVHTNKSAMIALQNLNNTTSNLNGVQNRISTGLNVNSAKDNASVYAIAQGQRADVSSLAAVTSSLNRAASISDVSLAAGETVSDLLVELREKVVSAMDPSIDTASRNALNSDFRALLNQIKQTTTSANFDGANILDGSLPNGIQFIADADATSNITLSTRDLSLGGTTITLTSGSTIMSATVASGMLVRLDTSIQNVNAALGALGSQAKQIDGHLSFVSKLTDSLNSGIGNLVDADMAKESAKLQALQVQQQLGTQALSIANSGPQVILSLFQGG
ncbi:MULTISPECIES: flagellin [Asticcacaulis]|jgi:flagellin|uniref:Flagellin n=1 Tax=Asticcacaulis endophyticus TaxID=1395890 RepID=A0A918QC63_9CAUL|nr:MULTISPECIES: flagellin [Asticcacaulis]WKL56315.1 flagellin [Asticcacaulis sp. ZE23SCel15]GGZ39472.1 flagellin [Asticcacaulis endophyticus]